VWTPERDTELIALWSNEKYSTMQMATAMRLTKGQVIGRAHRLRLPQRKPPRRYNYPTVRRSPGASASRLLTTPIVPLTPAAPEVHEPPREYKTVKSLIDLREDQCKFPIEDGMWCGRPRWDRSPYCEEHHRVCFHKGREMG